MTVPIRAWYIPTCVQKCRYNYKHQGSLHLHPGRCLLSISNVSNCSHGLKSGQSVPYLIWSRGPNSIMSVHWGVAIEVLTCHAGCLWSTITGVQFPLLCGGRKWSNPWISIVKWTILT